MPCSYDYSNDCCESQPATSTTNSRTGTSLITELQQRHSSIRTSPELLRTEEMDDFLPDIDNDCKLAANSLTIPQSEYSTDHYILNTLLNSFVDAILSFTSVSRTTNVVDDLLFDDQKQPVYFNMRLFDCTDTLLESWLMTIDNNKINELVEEQQQLYPRIVELITCRLSVERRQANVKSFTVKAINFNQSDSEALLSQLRDANGDFIGPHLEFLTIENDSLSHIQLSSSFIIPLPISHPPDSPVMCDKRPAVSLDAYRRVNSGSPFPSEDLQSHLAQFSRMKLIRTKKKRIVKSPEMEISASPIASSVAGPISSSSASLCVSPKKNSSVISGERSPIEIHFCGKDVINSSPETSSIARPLPIRKAAAKPANSSPLASPTGQSLLLSPDLLSSLQAYRGKRRSSFQGSLVGSYEESILNGRLSAPPSKPIEFHCQIGVLAMGKTEKRLRCPPHVVIPFSASFYEWQQSRNNNSNKRSSLPSDKSKDRPADQAGREMRTNSLQPTSNTLFTSIADELGTPFVGVVDLEWGLGPGNGFGYAFMNGDSSAVTNLPPHRSPDDPIGYWQIPVKGQLQLLVKNPNKAAIKVFLIPYDLQAMPPSTKTFLRQKSLETLPADGSIEKGPLRYAAHLQFACLPALASPGNDDDDLSSIISPLSSLSTSPASSSTAFPLSTTRSTSSSSSSSRRKHLRYFLCKSIRLVFGQRASETGENLQVVYEMPDGRFPSGTCAPVDPSLRYLPLSSPPFL